MKFRVDRFRAAAAAALALVVSLAAPSAAQQPPDIRGTYPVSGAQTIYDCNFEGSEVYVSPFSIFFVVEEQVGTHFSGYLGYPDQALVFISITGDVSESGELSGTWTYALDPQVDELFFQKGLSGRVADGKVEVEVTGRYGFSEEFSCSYRVAVASDSAVLQWSPPDLTASDETPPPRALTLTENPEAKAPSVLAPPSAPEAGAPSAERRAGEPTGYNVYRSTTPNVQTTPENLYTSVPPAVTTVPAPVGTGGSFFVVTATYPQGESGPSNEVSGGVPAATLASVKVTAKIVAKGTGFSSTVQVFVDGIPFVANAKVKANKKVVQKGAMLTGQTLGQYLTPGKTVAITFRNENGGVATYVHTAP